MTALQSILKNNETGPVRSLEDTIRSIYGNDRTIKTRRPVSGGDVNEASLLTLDDGSLLFMKQNRPDFLDNFKAEAAGLAMIRQTGAIGSPKLLGLGQERGFSFLLLEYVRSEKRVPDFWETFARELAGMHDAKTDLYCWADGCEETVGFGFFQDNWIGATRQINRPCASWIAFFRDCRLEPQFHMARDYFTAEDRKKSVRLLDHLDCYLTEPGKPALLHGDLWSGNMIAGDDGKGWLIDPAVYYGHPEADLAMTELFGGFSYQFYGYYKEIAGIDPAYEDRRDIYNLYHLLNHLNMFGSGYLGSVKRILDRFSL